MLWEAISNTRKTVSSDIQTLRSWFEKIRLRLVFSIHFSVFGCLMKHSSSCLIYYLPYNNIRCPVIGYRTTAYHSIPEAHTTGCHAIPYDHTIPYTRAIRLCHTLPCYARCHAMPHYSGSLAYQQRHYWSFFQNSLRPLLKKGLSQPFLKSKAGNYYALFKNIMVWCSHCLTNILLHARPVWNGFLEIGQF